MNMKKDDSSRNENIEMMFGHTRLERVKINALELRKKVGLPQ